MSDKIWLSSPHMSDEGYEMEYVQEAFDTNWVAPIGSNLNNFEKDVSEKVGVNNAVALVTGTAAIHMALKAAGVEAGDIVFCQSLTFSGSANPIMYLDAIPVFIDSDYKSWNIDPDVLEEACIKYPEVKAIIVVHLYGFSSDLDKILEICKRYDVKVIEDAAESLGCYYKGKHTGSFGDYGVFSFNGNKIITTSGGGMLVSNNKERIEKVRFWSTQSRDQERHYQHSELGYNYRMSNVVAGIGRGQMKVLDQRVAQKKHIYDYYKKALVSISDIEFIPVNEYNEPNYWLTCILMRGEVRPLQVIEALEKENIESRPVWKPMHMQPFFKEFDYIGGHVCEDIFENGICLPSDTKMTDSDLEKICNIIIGTWG